MPEVLRPWRAAGDNATAAEVAVTQNAAGQAIVHAKLSIPVATSNAEITYTIDSSGGIHVKASVHPVAAGAAPADELARVGFQAGILPSLNQVEWLGLGPDETYSDRKSAGRLGLYRGQATEWYHCYQPPQETGHRSGLRFVRITDAAGCGIFVGAQQETFGMNLWPWTAEDLGNATHSHLLKKRGFLTLTLDHVQMGVGGVAGWGQRQLDQYLLKAGRPYEFELYLEPAKS